MKIKDFLFGGKNLLGICLYKGKTTDIVKFVVAAFKKKGFSSMILHTKMPPPPLPQSNIQHSNLVWIHIQSVVCVKISQEFLVTDHLITNLFIKILV